MAASAFNDSSSQDDIHGWAIGFTFFASIVMGLMGAIYIIQGLAAVLDDSFYSLRPQYSPAMDITTWGWIQIVGGIVIVMASFGLLFGSRASRIVAIIFAGLSVLWSFYSMPYYPIWSVTTLALSVGVLWALIVHPHVLDVYEVDSPLDRER
ncbi:MAG TPA: hypothetical protein VFY10_05400 [Dehalococcoidia bacterium]|nr:hypothetical protein [Dehalococcoidia bacterium]